jgi:gliding motility-associated-like protein
VATQDLDITIIPADAPQCCGEVEAGEPAFSCTLSIGLNATPGNTGIGVWTGPAGATFADASDPQTTATMPAGTGGAHWFYWTEDDGNFCFLVDSVEMTVTDPIVITVSTTDAICFGYCDGTASALIAGGNPGVLNNVWSTGASGSGLDAIADLCAGNYSLTVTDVEGCSGSADFAINEPILLEIDSIVAIPETCFGNCDGSILVLDAQAVEYSYDAGNSWGAVPFLDSLCVGTFAVSIRDAAGCIGTGSTEVTGPQPVVADFTWTPNPSDINNPAIIFFNQSTGANRFEWDIAGLANANTADAQYRFSDREPGVYEVCLTAFNSNDCSDTVCYNVIIDDVLFVYVPNAFTPDADGVNDTFQISTSIGTITDFQMLIFDRWGQVVFETTDFGEAWTGKYRNSGDALATGVYTYRIIYAIPETSQRKEILGSVTLLK